MEHWRWEPHFLLEKGSLVAGSSSLAPISANKEADVEQTGGRADGLNNGSEAGLGKETSSSEVLVCLLGSVFSPAENYDFLSLEKGGKCN